MKTPGENQLHSSSMLRAVCGFALKALYVIIATLLLSEVAVQLSGIAPKVYRLGLGREGPLIRSQNKNLGYEYRKNFRDREHRERNLPPQTNSVGFRDRERTPAPPPGTKRIAVLGDSVIDGNFSESLVNRSWGLYDFANTIPAQMEKKLGPGFEVLNMGVNGYSCPQIVESFLQKGASFHPDIVLLNFLEMNFDDGTAMMGAVEESVSQPFEKAFQFMFVHSDLFRFLSVRLNFPKFKKHVDIENIFSAEWPEEKWKYVSPSLVELRKQVMSLPYRPDAHDHFYEAKNWPKEVINEAFDQSINIDHLDHVLPSEGPSDGRERCRKSLATLLEKSKGNRPFKILLAIWPSFRDDRVMDVDFGKRLIDPSDKSHVLEIEKIASNLKIPTLRLSRGFQSHYDAFAKSRSEKIPSPRVLYSVGDGSHPNPFGAEIAANLLNEFALY